MLVANFGNIETRPGDSLIHFTCFPNFEQLRREFDILSFFDLCAGIEAAILHERLVMVSRPPIPELQTAQERGRRVRSLEPRCLAFEPHVLDPLLQAGVIFGTPFIGVKTLSARAGYLFHRFNQNINVNVEDLSPYEALRKASQNFLLDLTFEEELGINFTIPAHILPAYMQLPEVEQHRKLIDQIDTQFATTYEYFKQTLFNQQREFNKDTILVPPIALEVLGRASTPDELAWVILDMRHSYRRLRQRFADLDEIQERLIKNRARLFTFLRYDGVPWNNNAAENAIKQFGYYREDAGRNVKEAGLTEHLALLSIYQTCRARRVSFLKFLLSRERDLDTFCRGKRVRSRRQRIELYPKGFIPSSLVRLRQAKPRRWRVDPPAPLE
jgi:hypothetical protein